VTLPTAVVLSDARCEPVDRRRTTAHPAGRGETSALDL